MYRPPRHNQDSNYWYVLYFCSNYKDDCIEAFLGLCYDNTDHHTDLQSPPSDDQIEVHLKRLALQQPGHNIGKIVLADCDNKGI